MGCLIVFEGIHFKKTPPFFPLNSPPCPDLCRFAQRGHAGERTLQGNGSHLAGWDVDHPLCICWQLEKYHIYTLKNMENRKEITVWETIEFWGVPYFQTNLYIGAWRVVICPTKLKDEPTITHWLVAYTTSDPKFGVDCGWTRLGFTQLTSQQGRTPRFQSWG